MPLLDHFPPPLAGRRHWESFHASWASCVTDALNDTLPEDYFAEAKVRAWPRIEFDSATQLTTADLTLPAVFPPEFGVNVYETSGGPTPVAAIELVSPGNKDREETRRAFAAKCATYVQRAIGLIVIDIVTSRQSRPFDELMAQLAPEQTPPLTPPLTAVSYRPVRVNGADSLELRIRPLAVGELLPTLPLALGGLGHVMLDLEATYEDARERSRL
ncbi:hypothetical protein [Zavarzinella formosa]|uniref:hypothetical protein n=1 Tax=Zavarzinella formosa TaxID=360055 RepID=UPI0002DAF1B6|nr:hypothetical protein [Zavarzinella formosa]